MSEARSDTPSIADRLRPVSEGGPAAFAAHFISDTALLVLGEECLLIVPRQGDARRVAVHAGAVNAVPQALTRSGGMAQATLGGLGAAPHYLYVCGSGATVDAAGCGPAANQLTRRAAFVLLSAGPNGSSTPGEDEQRNLDGDGIFVARDAAADGFDDLLEWGSIHLVIHRLVTAGRLP